MLAVDVAAEVADALAERRPVVALESTIFSNLGLPAPANAEALDRCLAAIRGGGAVPAVTAVLDGVARVGLAESEHGRILGAARKTAERDVAVAVAQRWPFGATTVSASLALADLAGVRSSPRAASVASIAAPADTGDVSADLGAIASHPLVTVCAGAKAFLDLGRTLEELERIGVPVLGWRHDDFPAFYTRCLGLPGAAPGRDSRRGGCRPGQPGPGGGGGARRRAHPRGRRPRPGGPRRRARSGAAGGGRRRRDGAGGHAVRPGPHRRRHGGPQPARQPGAGGAQRRR